MVRYNRFTLAKYLDSLAAREPTPGGGSAAALSGALGAGLMEMVLRYSLGKGKAAGVERKLAKALAQASQSRIRLLHLVSLDAEAYLALRAAKKAGPARYRSALKKAAAVPREIASQSAKLQAVMPFLRQHANVYLLSDVVAANALLQAAESAARAMIEANA